MRSDLLHVIGVYSNPRRYQARTRLLREWIARTLDAHVELTLVEHAFGERPYELSKSDLGMEHVNLVQVRGGPAHELWLKEGLINLGIARLPEDARYVCWEDTDVTHVQHDWAAETVHMLQHHRVGQTWSHSLDLAPNGESVPLHCNRDVDRSFCAAWLAGDIDQINGAYATQLQARSLLPKGSKKDPRRHPGYSWAIRREVLNDIGRLLDWLVTGSADYHMALAFTGLLTKGDERMSAGYLRRLREFAKRCDAYVKQDVGYVPGLILHHWHGPKRDRFYVDRYEILLESHFDPDVDLAYDVHGLPMLVSDNRELRDGLRRYLSKRNEDSIDL